MGPEIIFVQSILNAVYHYQKRVREFLENKPTENSGATLTYSPERINNSPVGIKVATIFCKKFITPRGGLSFIV